MDGRVVLREWARLIESMMDRRVAEVAFPFHETETSLSCIGFSPLFFALDSELALAESVVT